MKPTRAWAVVTDGGDLSPWSIEGPNLPVYATLDAAAEDCWEGERVIEVLITPIEGQADELRGKR